MSPVARAPSETTTSAARHFSVTEDPLQPRSCAERLKALSEPCRLRIVSSLRDGPKNVSDLAAELDISIVTVSHHLGILRAANLVQCDREGRFIIYRLPAEVFQRPKKANELEYLDLGCCRLEMPKDQS